MRTMSCRVSFYLIFLFFSISNGQIVYVPAGPGETSNVKHTLIGKEHGPITALKAKRPGVINPLPSQWALGPEGTPRWPNGDIPYYIDRDSYGEGIIGRVVLALVKIKTETNNLCPSFTELSEKPDGGGSWLHFTNPDRVRPCVHDHAKDVNGEIEIILGYDCLKPKEILHSILHGLGFRDEVTHPQRDLFVRVMWENIQPAFRSMFRIQSVETNDASLMEYDPMSVMHFHDRAYSLNGQATIMPMLPGLKIEPSEDLSHLDKMKIRRMFGHECKKSLVSKIIGSACANWHDQLKGDMDENRNNLCPGANNNGGDQIVIPGNDVNVGEGSFGDGGGDQVVIPGHDVDVANQISNEGGDAQDLVPGSDVGGDKIIVPGYDVKTNDVGDGIKVIDHSSGEVGKSIKKLNIHNNNFIPGEEAIIVGYKGAE